MYYVIQIGEDISVILVKNEKKNVDIINKYPK